MTRPHDAVPVTSKGYRLIRPKTATWAPTTVEQATVEAARELLDGVASVVLLTGAGVSTASGIPDYRGPDARPASPMLLQDFVSSATNRRYYWARNYRGWAHLNRTQPNDAHLALARWEAMGVPAPVVGLITQNVDGLHRAAGSTRLLELHGRSSDVICLDCGQVTARSDLQVRLAELNPGVVPAAHAEHAELRPDADALVEHWEGFRVADCLNCGGVLKPDVTFFGEGVLPERVQQANAWCDAADAMVVAGSSLTVMSGLRFPRAMAKAGKPVVIINHGATRGDDLAALKIDGRVERVLAELVGAGVHT